MFNKLRRKMSEYDNQCILLHTKARQTENKAVSTLHCKPPPVEAIKKNLSRGSDFHQKSNAQVMSMKKKEPSLLFKPGQIKVRPVSCQLISNSHLQPRQVSPSLSNSLTVQSLRSYSLGLSLPQIVPRSIETSGRDLTKNFMRS